MGAKPFEIHPAALAELKSAVLWYQERNQNAALNFVSEVERAADLVLASPSRWPSGKHGTRKFVLQRFPFAIVYREKTTVIQILAIAHGHRRPGYWTERL
jgi:plasmid stabilization system protein ParE